jgi:hypothetical protein
MPATNAGLSVGPARQTLVCPLGQRGKRFCQRSLATLLLRELAPLWRWCWPGTGGRLKADHHPVSMKLILTRWNTNKI